MGFIEDLIKEKYNILLNNINNLIQLNKLKGDVLYKKNNIKLYLDEFDKLKTIKYTERKFFRDLDTSQCKEDFNTDTFYQLELGQNPQGYFYTSYLSMELVYNKIYFVDLDQNQNKLKEPLANAFNLLGNIEDVSLYYLDDNSNKIYFNHNPNNRLPIDPQTEEILKSWENFNSIKNGLINNLTITKNLIINYINLLTTNLNFFNSIKNNQNQYISLNDLDSTESWEDRINFLTDKLNTINNILNFINNQELFHNKTQSDVIYNNIDRPIYDLLPVFDNLLNIISNENAIKTSNSNFWKKFKFWIKQYIDKLEGGLSIVLSFENLKIQALNKISIAENEIKELNNGTLPIMYAPKFLTYNTNKEEEPIITGVKDLENNKIKLIINYVWEDINASTKYSLRRKLIIENQTILDNNIKTFSIENDNECIKNDKGDVILPKKPATSYQEIVEILLPNPEINQITINQFEIGIKYHHIPYNLEHFNINTFSQSIESEEHVINLNNKIIQI